jgi:hypothetical protein
MEAAATESSGATTGRAATEAAATESSGAATGRSAAEAAATKSSESAAIRRSASAAAATESSEAAIRCYASAAAITESSEAAIRCYASAAAITESSVTATGRSASEAAAAVGVTAPPPAQAAFVPEVSKVVAPEAAKATEVIKIVKPAPEPWSKSPSEPGTDAHKNAVIEILRTPIPVGCTCIGVIRVISVETVRRWPVVIIVWAVVRVISIAIVAAVDRPHSDSDSESNLGLGARDCEREKPECTDANDEQVFEISHLVLLTRPCMSWASLVPKTWLDAFANLRGFNRLAPGAMRDDSAQWM